LHRLSFGIIVVAALAFAAFSLPARSLGADRQVAYTAGQLAMGQATYTQYCSFCHLPTLAGNPQTRPPRPPLTGQAWATKWRGKTAADLFDYAAKNMPYGKGGSLEHDQYMAIVAYILKQNGVDSEGKILDDKSLPKINLP
jgi:mono/diheme cytochrome c family protein